MSVPNFIRGKLWINHTGGKGFSESYDMNTTDRSTARVLFASILNYRSLLLPLNTSIVYHSLSLIDSTRDVDLVPTFLSEPAETDAETGNGVEACAYLETGIHVRYYTADGKRSSRIFRGIRDSWEEGGVLTVTPTAYGSFGALPAAAAGLTDGEALGSFLTAVLTNTVKTKKLATDPVTYDVFSWQGYGIRGISDRDCGPGFSYGRGRRRATV